LKKIALVATLVASLCAAPALADKPAEKPSKSKRCAAVKKAFVLGGNPSADGSSVINVKSRNRHARRYLGTATTYDLANAKDKDGNTVAPKFVGVVDGPDEGTDVGMSDVLTTDKVKVKGYITVGKQGGKKKVCPGADSAVIVKSVRISRPAPEPTTETTTPPAA
jgi:hypothetical protein